MKERMLKAYFKSTCIRSNSLNLNEEYRKDNDDSNNANSKYDNEEEDASLDEIEALEQRFSKRTTKKEPQALMTLVLGDHFLTFQDDKDLFTLLYTSIIFKWFASERVSVLYIIYYCLMNITIAYNTYRQHTNRIQA
jgi:hypothetical protein